MERTSHRSQQFKESVIREMTRVARSVGAVNLSQGLPDLPAPDEVKEAAVAAIRADINQYAITWGSPNLRTALATHYHKRYGMKVDPETNIVVCCGATECMIATLMAICNPGDEVIIFEPYYENYGPDSWLSGATPRFVSLRPQPARDPHTGSMQTAWVVDLDQLRAAFNERTKAIIVNTPHNPTGHVFTRAELQLIADLCIEHDVIAVTDEIYEFIIYGDHQHHVLATFPGMADRTVTISGMSKTFSVTGWRLGTCIAPADITNAIRKVHDFLTVGAPAPLQEAAAVGLGLPDSYFIGLKAMYTKKRDYMMDVLSESGFDPIAPDGAYYIMANIGPLKRAEENGTEFAMRLAREGGVATVPGTTFFWNPADGDNLTRFAYCKQDATLQAGAEKLLRFR